MGKKQARWRGSPEVREWLEEVAEAEVPAAADREHWAKCLTNDAACLPFGMVGEPRRKLSPITTLVLLLSMGVDLMDIRVSAEFSSLRQRAAFCRDRARVRGGMRPGARLSYGAGDSSLHTRTLRSACALLPTRVVRASVGMPT